MNRSTDLYSSCVKEGTLKHIMYGTSTSESSRSTEPTNPGCSALSAATPARRVIPGGCRGTDLHAKEGCQAFLVNGFWFTSPKAWRISSFDRDDANHGAARETWQEMLSERALLVSSNYALLETTALLQHRLGVAAVRSLYEDVVPLLRVEWVTPEMHHAASEAMLAAGRRRLSLVDCVSFQTMRQLGIRTAFCFDAHFREQGFVTRPRRSGSA